MTLQRTASLIVVCVFVASSQVHGHLGDRVIPIYEITDNEVGQIDLKDGRIDEWEDLGEASLSSLDFAGSYVSNGEAVELAYDPSDLDFRMWFGWNATHQRLYASMQFVDDAIFFVDELGNGLSDHLSLAVDGDHSGGQFFYFSGETELHLQQAQNYRVPARVIPDDPVEISWGPFERPNWMVHPPYADGGRGVLGENPFVWTIEFYVTPFDALIWDDQEASVVSRWEAGMVIGLFVFAMDVDSTTGEWDRYNINVGDHVGTGNADDLIDGLLLGAGVDMPVDSAVSSDSWGRIKASLR